MGGTSPSGDGGAEPARRHLIRARGSAERAPDLTGKGEPDVLVGNQEVGGYDGQAALGSASVRGPIASVDLDGDGRADLWGGDAPGFATLWWLRGAGPGYPSACPPPASTSAAPSR